MRIGIDILGGDFAPEATIKGAVLARKELKDSDTLVLIGDRGYIENYLSGAGISADGFEIIHTTENIGMDEYPAKAFAQKPNASIAIGFKMLAAGQIDGFASAGNTGAMLVGGMHIVKSIPGIIRPCITAPVPREDGGQSILLDVGLNPDCKPDVLYQYGVLGSLYAEKVNHVKNPRVALFNIGKEEEKGNLLTKAAHQAMKGTNDFNFIGNIEGNDLFSPDVDVIVCDGFVGNTILKVVEAFYALVRKNIPASGQKLDKFNWESHGGTPILGINSTAIIGHGISNDVAIKNMILLTANVAEARLPEKIKEAIE